MQRRVRVFAVAMLLASAAHPAWAEESVSTPGEAELARALEEIAALRTRVEQLEAAASARSSDDDELEALRREARELAAGPEPPGQEAATETELRPGTTFTGRERAQQALNPEISLVADLGVTLGMRGGDVEGLLGIFDGADDDEAETGFYLRELELNLQADLDPFSFIKVTLGVGAEGLELEEAYVTWPAIARGLGLSLGRFRQQLGVINRWHPEALDQVDAPLAAREILGPEGLAQVGLSLEWLLPSRWDAASFLLVAQVAQPTNDHLFSGEYIDVPTALLRFQSYFDLTPSLYLQIGLSGMWGLRTESAADVVGAPVPAYDENGEPILLYDEAGELLGPLLVDPPAEHVEAFRGNVWLGGADLTLSWAPLDRERSRHVTWRSELYAVSQETREGRLQALGAYSYLDVAVTDRWGLGVRGDVTQPFELDNAGRLRWQVVGYLTWWQSEWVRLRLQYAHAQGAGLATSDRLTLQLVFAAGPHRHERY